MLSAFGQAFKDNGYQFGQRTRFADIPRPFLLAGDIPDHSELARESQNRMAVDDPNNPAAAWRRKSPRDGF